MAHDSNDRSDTGPSADPPGTIRDRRIAPRGVLPRHVQMWLMVALAMVILAIIFFTGQREPLPRPAVGGRAPQPALVPPERVKSYGEGLAAEAARQQQAVTPRASGRTSGPVRPGPASAADPLADERRRLDYTSLFADNVALSRRAVDRQPFGEPRTPERATSDPTSALSPELALLQQVLSPRPSPSGTLPPIPPATPAIAPPVAPAVVDRATTRTADEGTLRPLTTGPIRAGDDTHRLLEGTVIETVLLNRLDGTFAGPVDCLVTTPVYSHDRQSVVIPAGARVLGTAAPVQTWGDSRLAVSFHRLVMPDGRTHRLDRFKGLGQAGDTGLKDRVDRHYLQVFGASLAIGALSGLAQFGSRNTADAYSFGDAFRQGAGSSLAASAGRVLDRYLNVLPTITIREGYRIKVYLTNDLDLPTYARPAAGGVR